MQTHLATERRLQLPMFELVGKQEGKGEFAVEL